MTGDPGAGIIAHAIQLAVAPVFLLTGVAGLLSVMVTRLGRVIDRARVLATSWASLDAQARTDARFEMDNLTLRRRASSWSIAFCSAAALLVCLVIVTLFAEEFFATNLKWLAGGLFVAAMAALIGGLSCFLREILLATYTAGIELARFE
jgi:hypothetical protein